MQEHTDHLHNGIGIDAETRGHGQEGQPVSLGGGVGQMEHHKALQHGQQGHHHRASLQDPHGLGEQALLHQALHSALQPTASSQAHGAGPPHHTPPIKEGQDLPSGYGMQHYTLHHGPHSTCKGLRDHQPSHQQLNEEG
jgi:hypothetical protein